MTQSTGVIKISVSAAEQDKKNLENARTQLEQSKQTISKLKNIAAAMQGQTGQAIVEQCQKLETKIDNLLKDIATSKTLITNVVNEYNRQDRENAAKIRNSN